MYRLHANRNSEICVRSFPGGVVRNLTRHPAFDRQPTWSPDGSKIAFATNRDGNYEIYAMRADGSTLTNLTKTSSLEQAPDWDAAADP